MTLTSSQKIAASMRVADGDPTLLEHSVPFTSATGRYDDGIDDLDPAEFERQQADAQRERFQLIAQEEARLGRQRSNTPAVEPAPVNIPKIPEAMPFRRTPENAAALATLEKMAAAAQVNDDEYGPDDEHLRPTGNAPPLVEEESAEADVPEAEAPQAAVERSGNGRLVVRARDGAVFQSVKAAALSIGVSENGMRTAIKGDRPCKGETFFFAEGPVNADRLQPLPPGAVPKPNAMRASIPIRHVKTGVVYPSQKAACVALNLHAPSLAKAIAGNRPYLGERFVRAEAPDPVDTARPTIRRNVRRVVNVQTGDVYESICDASRKTQMSEKAMRNAIVKRVQFHLEGETPLPPSTDENRTRYRCIETGRVYDSSEDAALVYHISPSGFRARVSDNRAIQGHHFVSLKGDRPDNEVRAERVEALTKNFVPPAPVEPMAPVAPLADDTTFLARTMFAFAKGGGSIDQIDTVVSEARRITEARRLIAAIDGQQGGGIALRDGRLVAVGENS